MFIKYPSLENHYNLIPQYLYLDMYVSISEKIDGSNFSIIVSPHNIEYASRNQVVESTWNNLCNIVDNTCINNLVYESTKVGIINVYGEVFSSKILRRIPYGETKARFFAASIDGVMLSGAEFAQLASRTNLPVVTTVITTLKAAMEFDVETLSSNFARTSIAEGIVIHPYYTNKINDRVYAIKFKSKQFSELSGTKVKTPKSLSAQQVEFANFVNENRMLSYISKEGEPTSMQDMGKYIKGILQDALDEYLSTLSEEDKMKAHEDKAITKVGSSIIAPMLRNRIQTVQC